MYKPLLTADDIYKKEFKTGLRGYVIEDVDGYLDQIIKDYEGFEREIERLKKENRKNGRNVASTNRSRKFLVHPTMTCCVASQISRRRSSDDRTKTNESKRYFCQLVRNIFFDCLLFERIII